MKTVVLIAFVLVSVYRMLLLFLGYRSADNPTPENVRDVYDDETYARWKQYHAEKTVLSLAREGVSSVLTFLFLLTNAYAAVARPFGGGAYAQAFAVVGFDHIVGSVFGLFFEYRDSMVIEEKYGFNRSTKKTFSVDQVKSFVLGLVVSAGLTALLVAVHRAMGDWMAVLFAAALFAVILAVSFLYPVFSRVFNRFTPLEDGELRARLTELLTRHGYRVRDIKVMDASRRSTKSNAYFTGFGRMKTIVLYDTLLSSATPDEIVAVFAHEMGHGLHRDTLKNQLLSFGNIALLALAVWLTVRTDALFAPFGFADVNYGFAVLLLLYVEFALISPLLGLVVNARSRRAEYRADRQAVSEGYANALVSALKKLARENFSNLSPSPALVRLEYSHPPLSERIRAIEACVNQERTRSE